ncbi:MAG: hypothetical protein C0401_11315 [Anaerolinea sp.]|nr:hypothetical protein [Anaerolinea sp.]
MIRCQIYAKLMCGGILQLNLPGKSVSLLAVYYYSASITKMPYKTGKIYVQIWPYFSTSNFN